MYIVIRRALIATALSTCGPLFAQEASQPAAADKEPIHVLEKFVLEEKVEDPMGVMPKEPTGAAFGLSLTPLETPRSMTFLSGEMLEQYGVNDIADLVRVAPSTYTTFNFGIQGGVDIRNVSADSYFRGIKRVENRSAIPTPLGATDRVEIVRGPPSPIYGSGKIGGYMNYVPKTARASTGKYLDVPVGKVSVTYGDYNKRILTAEVGGAAKLGKLPAGYYVYTQFEDSDSFYNNATKKQEILQATFNVDLNRAVRIEAGTMLQHWRGVGVVGWNRLTQDLVDNGTYKTGLPLVNLDTNGSGAIELAEINASGSDKLIKTLTYNQYLGLAARPTLQPQFALDPATVGTTHLDTQQVILEPFVDAHDEILFADLILDRGGLFTVTNKMYAEQLLQLKSQYLSFARRQDQFSFEDKLLFEQKPLAPFPWVTISNALALSVRYSDNDLATSGNFQIYARPDIARALVPNVIIANSLDDPIGFPWGSRVKSTYTEYGAGVLSSIDFKRVPLSVILGGRYDTIDATSATPPALAGNPPPTSGTGTDWAFSQSISASVTAFEAFRPYVTTAVQNVLVIGNGGTLSVAAVNKGAYDDASLFETGVKGSLLAGKLFYAAAYFDQTRKSLDSDTGETTATKGTGYELEVKFVPHKRLSLSVSANWQKTVYDPVTTRTYMITPEIAGYTAQQGNAGLIRVTLPASDLYAERPGSPKRIFSVASTYYLTNQWALSGSVTHQDKFFADVMKTITLPAADVFNLSVIFNYGRLSTRLSVSNLTDERYFRANQPDTGGGIMALPNPGRTTDLKFTYEF